MTFDYKKIPESPELIEQMRIDLDRDFKKATHLVFALMFGCGMAVGFGIAMLLVYYRLIAI